MAEVDYVEFDHNFGSGPCFLHVKVPPHLEGMNRFRRIFFKLETDNDPNSPIGQIMKVTIKEYDGHSIPGPFGVTLLVTCYGRSDSLTIPNGRIPLWSDANFVATLFEGKGVILNAETKLKITFNRWGVKNDENQDCDSGTLLDDLKQYAEAGNKISLIGSDGEVTVSGRLLEARSPTFMAMLTHDTKEKKESKISLVDYNSNLIRAFVDFLTTDKLVFNKDTILELYILGDMYHVRGLKSAAKKLILANIKELDQAKVFDVISKVDTDLVKKCFMKEYA